jgi:hypothetical protein
MRVVTGLLAAASLGLMVLPASAQAVQTQIYPRCARMKDPVACTCALETGGVITPRGYWTYSSRNTPVYFECMRRAGRT